MDDTNLLPNDVTQCHRHRRRRKNRQIDWDKLPQIRHEHDLSEEEKNCSCCGRRMDCIGEDVTRELELQPAKLEAHIHVRPKYACRRCKHGVSAAPLPPRPIPGGIAGPGLITEVVVGKFGDHLPRRCASVPASGRHSHTLRRLHPTQYPVRLDEGRGLSLSSVVRSPMPAGSSILPDVALCANTDDTRVTVLGGKEGSFKGYFWTYIGDEQNPYSVYDFTASRSRDGPARFLEGYSGYLHADAFTGYDAMFLDIGSNVIEVACWAHARRKFLDAAGSNPREAHQVLEWIRQLYDIEDRAHDLSVDARRELRAREAMPVLDKIETYLRDLAPSALPKSSWRKAVTYAR
ncbi:MAG: transposase, partial [Planctomycetes bacterium]|nr:transposase [Planctomycetota bacterium]